MSGIQVRAYKTEHGFTVTQHKLTYHSPTGKHMWYSDTCAYATRDTLQNALIVMSVRDNTYLFDMPEFLKEGELLCSAKSYKALTAKCKTKFPEEFI